MFDLSYLDNDIFGFNMETFNGDADLEETPEAYLLTMNVPGVSKENITIDFEDDILTVSVKKEASKEDNNKYLMHEIASSYNYSRGFEVDNADENSIKAKLENGVLAVVIAKKAPKQVIKKTISIE